MKHRRLELAVVLGFVDEDEREPSAQVRGNLGVLVQKFVGPNEHLIEAEIALLAAIT